MAALQHPSSEDYRKVAGFSNLMGWGTKPALVLIDVCKAYWTIGSPLDISSSPVGMGAPDSMRRLLDAARKVSVPIIWTKMQYNHPDMKDAGLFYLKAKALSVWQKGDKRGLDDWMEDLVPMEQDVVVVKQYASAFFGTSLASTLRTMGVDTLVICGVSTSGCVRATALDAMQNGFRPMVVGTACGDRSVEIQNANLFDLHAKYADVVEEREAIEKLSEGWL
ncbi:n-carbamoylsarcosine amidase [Moniliophthora roreri MCA 2997]|uniref:N-carbamoylsarcosine amidase n=2 Tax=Moniliophthora roreri TaxID=221103 RepID=V2Y9S3_MONRO|nr:n-carbamoylsarcosine amidase [Moniliophthora roreri MCA 2997]